MYKRLKDLYMHDRITKTGLQNAVKRGWITKAEMEEIIKEKNESAKTA